MRARERLIEASQGVGFVEVVAADLVAVLDPDGNRFAVALHRGATRVDPESKLYGSRSGLAEALETIATPDGEAASDADLP